MDKTRARQELILLLSQERKRVVMRFAPIIIGISALGFVIALFVLLSLGHNLPVDYIVNNGTGLSHAFYRRTLSQIN